MNSVGRLPDGKTPRGTMEIRNTAGDPELAWLDTPEPLEQLKIGLRNPGVYGPVDRIRAEGGPVAFRTLSR
jgi:hypothetical protein